MAYFDEEEDEVQQSGALAPGALPEDMAAPIAPPPPAPQASMGGIDPSALLAEYQKMNQQQPESDTDMNAAIEERNRLDKLAAFKGMFQGINKAVASAAGKPEAVNVDTSFISKLGQRGVDEAKEKKAEKRLLIKERKDNIKGLLDMYNTQQKTDIDMKKDQKYIEKTTQDIAKGKLEIDNEQLVSDPNSEVSHVAREVARKLNPKLAADPNFSNLNAKQVAELVPNLQTIYGNALKEREMALSEKKSKDVLGLKSRELDIKELLAKAKAAEGPKPGKGSEALSKETAKQYKIYVLGGGAATIQKNLTQLKKVRDALDTGKAKTGVTSGYGQHIPGIGQTFYADERNAKAAVDEVSQSNLRQVLGGQFAQKEGEQLIQRAYDATANPKENKARLDRLIKMIEDTAASQDQAYQYFEKNKGDMSGFESSAIRQPADSGEIERKTKDGRIAIFNADTKEFIRYKDEKK